MLRRFIASLLCGKTQRRISPQAQFRPLVEPLEARDLPAEIIWTGAGGPVKGGNYDWSNPANWQGGKVPDAADDVVFKGNLAANAKQVSVVDAAFEPNVKDKSVHSISANPGLNLQLDVPLTASAGVTFVTITISGNSNLRLGGTSTINSGNYISDPKAEKNAAIIVLDKATLNLKMKRKESITLNHRDLVVQADGAVYWQSGDIITDNKAIIKNMGRFVLAGTLQDNVIRSKSSEAGDSFNNVGAGQLEVDGVAGIYIPFNSTSSKPVKFDTRTEPKQEAHLALRAGGTISGEFTATGVGAKLVFVGGSFMLLNGTSLGGEGGSSLQTVCDGATLEIGADSKVYISRLKASASATITGERGKKSTLVIGSPNSNQGQPGSGSLEWDGATISYLTLDLIEMGSLTVKGTKSSAIDVTIKSAYGSGIHVNSGTWNLIGNTTINNGGRLTISAGASIAEQKKDGVKGTPSIINRRILQMDEMGTASITVPVVTEGDAKVIVKKGTLRIPSLTQEQKQNLKDAATVVAGGKLDTDGVFTMESGIFEGIGPSKFTAEIFGDVLNTGGAMVPGGVNAPGRIMIDGTTGSYTQSGTGALDADIFGPDAGTLYDQLVVTGQITLGGYLNVNAVAGFTGNSFIIIDNQGTNPVSGHFRGLLEGATLMLGGRAFTITYHGGPNGRDVVLNAVTPNYASTTTTLATSVDPAAANQPVTLTATVSAASGTPTGSVTFFANGVSLGTAPLVGDMATLTTTALLAGNDVLTATYSGDVNFASSTSDPVNEQVYAPLIATGVPVNAVEGINTGLVTVATFQDPNGASTLPVTIGDPSFEAVNVGTGTYYSFQYAPTDSAWTFNYVPGVYGSGVAGNGSGFTSGNPDAPEGTQVGFLQGDGSSISQAFTVQVAGQYVISFSSAQRENWQPAGAQTIEVVVDGTVVGTFTPGSTDYATISTDAVSLTAGSHTLAFVGLTDGDSTAFLDQVSVTSANPTPTYTASINWGDGNVSAGIITYDASSNTFTVSGSNTYAEEGNYTVTTTVNYGTLLQSVVSSTAQVADAPLSSSGLSFTATTGAPFSGTVAYFSDANPNGQAGDFTASIDWGDGTVTAGTITAAAPIADAGFEAVPVGTGSYTSFEYDPTGSAWNFSGSAGVAGNGSGFTSGNPNATEGTQVGFLQGTGSFSQTVTLPAGTYSLSFQAAQRGNWNQGGQTFEVEVDGNVVGTFTPSGSNYTTFTTDSFTVSGGNHTISFIGLNPLGGDNTAFVDQVTVNGAIFAVSGTHTYANPGQYPVNVQIADIGGSTTSALSSALVGFAPTGTVTLNALNNSTIGTVSFDDGAGDSGSVTAYVSQFNVTYNGSTGAPVTFDTFCIDLFHDVSVGQTYAVNARTDVATAFANGSRMAYVMENFGSLDLTNDPDQAAAVQIALWDLSLNNHNPTSFSQDADGTYSSGDENVFAMNLGGNPDAAHIVALVNYYLQSSIGATTQGSWLDAAAAGSASNRGQSLLIPTTGSGNNSNPNL